jgi:integrase
MAGRRKPPRLRTKDGCYIADFYRLDGGRSTISFGAPGVRTVGDIHIAFGKWLDLFDQHPHKVLDYKDPYEAIDKMVNPATIVTVGELYDKYVAWAKGYLPPLRDKRKNPDLIKIERLERFLKHYWQWPVASFGPDELLATQRAMVEYRYYKTKHPETSIPLTRTGINQLVNQFHKMWQWGVGQEAITQAQAQRLRQVRSLRIGRTEAKDKLKRLAVTEVEFNQVVANVNTVVADMLRLIWMTAMRPSEVCRMRPIDIQRPEPECWLYIPGSDVSPVGDHKTAHYQRVRAIPLTASAQEIIKRRIKDPKGTEPFFRPVDALEELRQKRFALRQTPIYQGNRPGTNCKVNPMIKPSDHYDSDSLAQAVKRACDRAGVARFSPYDLRRSVATRTRAILGKDAAKFLLGHVSSDTTEIYLLDEVREAMKVSLILEKQKTSCEPS